MGIKVHGHKISAPSNRVLLCLAEKDLDYEFVHVDLATGQHKKDHHISIHPFGQIPAFEDGDLKLFESRAITKYICHAYADKGTPLISKDPKEMGIISVWLEVEALKFDPVAQKLNIEIVIKPFKGMTPDEAVVEQLEAQLGPILDIYEARLAQSKYLAGDSYTLADLHHVPVINNLLKTRVKALFNARPHVSAWCDALLSRPATQKVWSK